MNILAEQATPPQRKRLATLHMMLGYDLVDTPIWTANNSFRAHHARTSPRDR